MDDREFVNWQKLLEERIGLWIPHHRKAFLVTKLALRMRELDFERFDEYFQSLSEQAGSRALVEWANLVDLLTVHETRFTRDPDSLALVREHCLGIIANEHKKNHVNVWSVGCSTGEEAYSLSMVLNDVKRDTDGTNKFYYGVTGMDISYPALTIAREGVYNSRRVALLPERWRKNYLIDVGEERFKFLPIIKERVCFVQGNIRDLAHAPSQKYDIIYCQNVLIYFQPPQRNKILNNLVQRLESDGLIVLAPGEVTNWKHPEMSRIDDKNCLAFLKVPHKQIKTG